MHSCIFWLNIALELASCNIWSSVQIFGMESKYLSQRHNYYPIGANWREMALIETEQYLLCKYFPDVSWQHITGIWKFISPFYINETGQSHLILCLTSWIINFIWEEPALKFLHWLDAENLKAVWIFMNTFVFVFVCLFVFVCIFVFVCWLDAENLEAFIVADGNPVWVSSAPPFIR